MGYGGWAPTGVTSFPESSRKFDILSFYIVSHSFFSFSSLEELVGTPHMFNPPPSLSVTGFETESGQVAYSFYKSVTNPYVLIPAAIFCLSAHILPEIPYNLQHFATHTIQLITFATHTIHHPLTRSRPCWRARAKAGAETREAGCGLPALRAP